MGPRLLGLGGGAQAMGLGLSGYLRLRQWGSYYMHRLWCSGYGIQAVGSSTTIRLRTFRLRPFVYRHFVYRHFVYYCIPAYRTVIHPTPVSANHYFNQFQLLLTL